VKLTDKTAIKMLEKARLGYVEHSLWTYPEDERDGRNDLQMLADETGYFYSSHLDDGHCLRNELLEARALLKRTKYGKVIPIDCGTFRPLPGYTPRDIEMAKECVNEFNRAGSLLKKLEKLGYYSSY